MPGPGRKFQKGNKFGGPGRGGGRKPGVPNRVRAELQAAAQEYTLESLGKLVEIMRGDYFEKHPDPEAPNNPRRCVTVRVPVSAETALDASCRILDRAHGRPRLSVEHSHAPVDLSQLTDDEAIEFYRLSCKLHGVEPNPFPGDAVDGTAAPAGIGASQGNRTQH